MFHVLKKFSPMDTLILKKNQKFCIQNFKFDYKYFIRDAPKKIELGLTDWREFITKFREENTLQRKMQCQSTGTVFSFGALYVFFV
jgi:hypothetical protein